MSREHWTEEQTAILRQWWTNSAPVKLWMHFLPGMSERAILARAHRLNLGKRPVLRKPTYVQSWECIKQVLADGSCRSVPELAIKTGFDESAVRKQMRDRIGIEVYVAEWRFEKNRYVARFSLGQNKPSARKPKPKTGAENQRAYYQRVKKEDPDKHDRIRAKERVRKAMKREGAIRPDAAASWMFNQC